MTLATAGWEIDEIALDLTRTGPKAEIRVGRHDGRWMLARVDQLGRASIERFQRERSLGMATNGTGRRPLSPKSMTFSSVARVSAVQMRCCSA